MLYRLINLCVATLLLSGSIPGQSAPGAGQISAELSPVGHWRTFDDVTGKVTSIVVIREENGKLGGEIEKLVDPGPADPDPRCLRCDGDAKGKPLIGLRILWNLRRDTDQWTGGRILDPDNGKVYRCDITLEDRGRRLRVRGFIGFSLLGRTQYWLRVE